MLIVSGAIESNPGPGSDRRVRVLDRIMMFWFDLDRIQLRIPGFGCPQERPRTPHLVLRFWLFMLGKNSAPSGRASFSVLATCLLCFVFAVG